MAVDGEQQQTKMETDDQSTAENNVKESSETEKPKEEEAEAAPAVKHLEENEMFTEYYMGQGILTAEEMEQFCETLKKPVPWTFRISNLGSNVSEVQTVLKSDFLSKNREALSVLPWYPKELAWQVNARPESDKSMEALNQFIVHETACGNVEQQDAVGMIPALLLKVEPHHKMLDMRAMRAVQLLDLIHSGCTVLDKNTDGVVIAGEPYYKRCCELAEFIPNLFSPHFAIANLDPANLLGLLVNNKENIREPLRYDRILCDLVSSNDGRCRSNLEGLHTWSPAISHDHHGRMCRMLQSGASQLAVGGRLVFCTYSMNPVENEAVVSTVLLQQKGSIELMDVSAEIPDLQYKNGLTKWKIMTRGSRWFEDYSDLRSSLRYRVNESLFPPPAEKVEQFHLERCIRILPHQQDTFGMFIAVLQRTRAFEDVLREEREAWAKAQREKIAAAKKRDEEAKAAAEKAEAEKAEAEKAAAASAEKESTEKDKDEEGEKSDEKPAGGEDAEKTKETPMDTSSKADSKHGSGSERKKEVKKSSESKKESADKEQTRETVPDKGSKTESSHKKKDTDEKKTSDDPSTSEDDHRSATDTRHSKQSHGDELPAKRRRRDMPSGDILSSFQEDDPVWKMIRDFFGISSDFPVSQLMSRGDDRASLFYVSPTLKHLIDYNQSTIDFVHAGVRVFCRMSEADSVCKYRITQEGLPAIYPFLSRQTVQITKEEFVALLTAQPVSANSFSSKTKQALSKLEKGNVVFVYRLNPRKADSSQLMMTGWSDGLHCRSFLAHYKRQHYLRACGVTVKDPDEKPLDVAATDALKAFAKAALATECY